MANSTLTLTILSLLLAKIIAENIEITTTSTITPSTNESENEKLIEMTEKPNNFIKSIENFLSEKKENGDLESDDQIHSGFIPHQMVPVYPAYSGAYFYPGVNPNAIAKTQNNKGVESTNYFSAVLPAAQAALKAGFQLFAKVGTFILGGAVLLIIGGIFTTLVCHITPLCTITFNGYDFRDLNKEAVKSLMTPEKIASAAALVQDAIGKYQRLQRAAAQ